MELNNKEIIEKVERYKNFLYEIGFIHAFSLEDIDESDHPLEIVDKIISVSIKLAKIFQNSPDSIYLADKDGTTIAVNRSFERTVGAPAKEVVGKNVSDLEAAGCFRPSVLRMAKEQNRSISVLQIGKHGESILATGVPIYDHENNLELLLSNARLIKEIEGIYNHFVANNINADKGTIAKDELILQSDAMKRILLTIEQIKDTDATLLITGASGVGKGVLARYIHTISCRSAKPMIEINCGAIPGNLLESELFGYSGGAFTGAKTVGKKGLIECADGGTLLLDEISELPLSLQVKLLKVLQDKEIVRIGDNKHKKVDIRIIAATNRNLDTMVAKGEFREDLYYRINVIPIEIPPLKEREEDVHAAVNYFIEKFAKKYKKPVVCSKEFVEAIINYDWPGNMRELENYIERSVLTTNDGILRADLGMGVTATWLCPYIDGFKCRLTDRNSGHPSVAHSGIEKDPPPQSRND